MFSGETKTFTLIMSFIRRILVWINKDAGAGVHNR